MAKKSFFLDYFPPPDYLRMPAAGFDVSDRSIKYIEMTRNGGFFCPGRFGKCSIPEGIIAAGEIAQPDKLIEHLKHIKSETKINYVGIGLPEEKSFLSRVKLPLMEESEVRGALELQLDEHVPLSVAEAVFDFKIINEGIKKDHMDVMLVAFPVGLIEAYENVFNASGLLPLFFETEGHAIIRAIVPREDIVGKRANMIIDFGKTRTTFIISQGGGLQFTSTIKIGGEELESAIVKTLKVDAVKAEKIKKDIGLSRKKEDDSAFQAMFPVISSIKDEAIKYIAYWRSHAVLSPSGAAENEISKIFLCGGDSNLNGMVEYFSNELKLPVQVGNPWVNMFSFNEYIPKMEKREALAYTTAIGLALRSINV